MDSYQMLIGGKWTQGTESFLDIDPSSGEAIATIPIASSEQVSDAVKAAKAAFPAWKEVGHQTRAQFLNKLANLLRESVGAPGAESKLARIIHRDMGKPFAEIRVEITEAADMVAYFADIGSSALSDKLLELDIDLWPTKRSWVVYEPYGVVAIVKPWNYPLETPLWSIAPALVAGNTVVFKPSEHSPIVGIEIAKLFQAAGLPDGVLNVITGAGETGRSLVCHPDVGMVSFTGSVKAGEDVATTCAQNHKKCSLELGGNDAAIVCDDADIDLTANGLIWGAFTNAGQVCAGIKRAFVHEQIAEQLIARVVDITKCLIPGHDIGPLISLHQLKIIEQFVADAVSLDAQVLCGGKRIERNGFFFAPTVLTNVSGDARLMHEEAFGPLLPICIVKDEQEAIRRANATNYGLGASLWTSDPDKGHSLARKVEAGMVWINEVNLPFPQAPWNGVKNSGPGVELSVDGLYEFVSRKHICFDTSSDITRDWWFPY